MKPAKRTPKPKASTESAKSEKPVSNPGAPDLQAAIISDIHGNLPALRATLKEIEDIESDIILCLGDTVGYGPDAVECVELVRDRCLFSLMGNHEAMMIYADEPVLHEMPAHVGAPLLKARKELSKEAIDWIKEQTLTAEIGPIGLSHGNRHNIAQFDYLFTPTEAKAHFAAHESQVSFYGHAHIPCLWVEPAPGKKPDLLEPVYEPITLDEKKRYAICVGSVGLPRDEDPRPCYVTYNPGTRQLQFRRVEL